jgi:hypothetical protein
MLIDADVIVAPPPPRRTKRRLLWMGMAVALAAAASAIGYRQIAADSAATFKTAAVATGDIEKSVTALGALQPKDYVDVGAQVSGQLKKVHVEIGDRVKQGDLLAEIDPTVLETRTRTDRADLANLHAQLAEQEANLVLARQQLKRNQNLFKAKIVSQDTLQTAEAQVAAGEFDCIYRRLECIERGRRPLVGKVDFRTNPVRGVRPEGRTRRLAHTRRAGQRRHGRAAVLRDAGEVSGRPLRPHEQQPHPRLRRPCWCSTVPER